MDTLSDVPRIVTDYLDELSIRCDFHERGCRELVQLQKLKQHVAECGFAPVACGNQGCGEILSKRDRTYHESELCEFRKLKCHNCAEMSAKMAGLETRMVTMHAKISNTETNLANVKTKVENMDTNITSINTKVVNLATSVETKVRNVDTKVKNVDTKVRNVDTKVESVDTIVRNVDTKVRNVNTKVTSVETKVTKFEANVEAKFEAVNNEVRGIKTSLNEVKDGFVHLKEAVVDKMQSKERKPEVYARQLQYIFVAGGYMQTSVEIFNYRQKLWSSLTSMPENRWGASSFVYNNHVTVAGGVGRSGTDALDSMIQMNIRPIFSDLSITCTTFAGKLPAKMFAHSSVVYKDSLYVTGGINADRRLVSDCIDEVQLKPPYAVKRRAKMPEPRVDHSTVVCDDSILIFGGTKTRDFKSALSSVVSYDIKKNECRQLSPLPYPVCEMASVKWGENAVVIGGTDKDGKALKSVIIYNTKTGNSHMLPPMLHKRKGCMAVVIADTIVVLGGLDERGNDLKSVEGFTFNRYRWKELPAMKKTRYLATAVVI